VEPAFDKVAKSLLQMNALFMPFAPLVSGRIWQGLDAKDKDLIRRLVAQSLDAQITDIVTTEAGLIEKFKATPLRFTRRQTSNPTASSRNSTSSGCPRHRRSPSCARPGHRSDQRVHRADA